VKDMIPPTKVSESMKGLANGIQIDNETVLSKPPAKLSIFLLVLLQHYHKKCYTIINDSSNLRLLLRIYCSTKCTKSYPTLKNSLAMKRPSTMFSILYILHLYTSERTTNSMLNTHFLLPCYARNSQEKHWSHSHPFLISRPNFFAQVLW